MFIVKLIIILFMVYIFSVYSYKIYKEYTKPKIEQNSKPEPINNKDENINYDNSFINDDILLADSKLCEPPKLSESTGVRDPLGKEVFLVGRGKYGYTKAKAVCEKLGTRLASENEVINANKLGANWCDYGWVDGKKAFFTVQKKFHELMDCKTDGKNPCGDKPGVHGGEMLNENLRYGATCFGIKPPKTDKQKKKEKEYNEILKSAYNTMYKEPTQEQLKEIEDKKYKRLLKNLDKDKLVNEVYEFDDYRVKWNNLPS